MVYSELYHQIGQRRTFHLLSKFYLLNNQVPIDDFFDCCDETSKDTIIATAAVTIFPPEQEKTAKKKKLVCIKKSEDAKIVPNLKFLNYEKRSKSDQIVLI